MRTYNHSLVYVVIFVVINIKNDTICFFFLYFLFINFKMADYSFQKKKKNN